MLRDTEQTEMATTTLKKGKQPQDYRRDSDIMTTGDVARLFRVAPRTVGNWFDKGLLPGYRIPGSLDRRFHRARVIAFGIRHGMLLPEKPFVVAYAALPSLLEVIRHRLGDRAEVRPVASLVEIMDAIHEGTTAVLVDTSIGALDAEKLLRAIPKSGRHYIMAFGPIDVPPLYGVRWLGRADAAFIAGALAEYLPAEGGAKSDE